METMQAKLKGLEAQLYHREEEVIAMGERLQKRADLQDVKVVPVYEAYRTMGLINEDQILGILGQFIEKNHEWIDSEFFWKKYGEINQKLNRLLPLLGVQNFRKETISQAEKVVADLMVILRYHWGTRADCLGRICNFISICKYSEYLTIVELENMPSGPAICNRLFDPSGARRVFDPFAPRSDSLVKKDLMNERFDHILDQLGFLLKEEEVLHEMQLISDERERLYEISRRLFLG